MFRSEHLTCFGLLIISVELVKEDDHYIFATPFIRIDAIRYGADIINERIDSLLIFRIIHINLGIYFLKDMNFHILLFAVFQRFADCIENLRMEQRELTIFQFLQSRSVSLCNQSTSREYHSMIQILDTEIDMKIVVDTTSRIIDFLCRYSLFIYQVDIELLVLNLIQDIKRLIITESPYLIPVM